MIKKPKKCCPCGSNEHAIPMPIKGKVCHIDFCIAKIVAALNAANIITVASCCGHGKLKPIITILTPEGDRHIRITDNIKEWKQDNNGKGCNG